MFFFLDLKNPNKTAVFSRFGMARRPSGFLHAFRNDTSGNVAMLFGLVVVGIAVLTGGSIHYSEWNSAFTRHQAAMDAAVLAGGRTLQTSGGDETAAIAAAESLFLSQKSPLVTDLSANFVIDNNANTITGTSSGKVDSPALSLIGIDDLSVNVTAEAKFAGGGNQGSDLEIAMMLDVSGSMYGQKVEDLKVAAKDLVNILVWDDQNSHTSKVAVVPFDSHVNVGDLAATVTGLPETKGNKELKPCVTEREGSAAFTDEAPGPGTYVHAYRGDTGSAAASNNGNYHRHGECGNDAEPLMPLTNDKTALDNYLSSITSHGGTGGQLGTAWSWYLLSPKWTGIWPSGSKPKPYTLLSQTNQYGQPKLRKIAVLMTDGMYDDYHGSYEDPNTVSANAVQICTNMKAEGIEIFTVGFQLPSGLPEQTLLACATDPAHHYDTTTGEELQQAFRDIALKIATLRISN